MIFSLVQRDFINFATAAGQYGSPQGYLALYFVLYLVASLFVFGLEVRSMIRVFLLIFFPSLILKPRRKVGPL
jgi:hypothetical protein